MRIYFTAVYSVTTPHKTFKGRAVSKSPKKAMDSAVSAAWDKLAAWDLENKTCSSIGPEGYELKRNGNTISTRWEF